MMPFMVLVAESASDVLNIVKEVHVFYQDAWTTLLWSLGSIGGIVIFFLGFVLPWLSERSRRESFKMDKEAVLGQIEVAKEEMQRRIEEASNVYKDNLRDVLKQIKDRQEQTTRMIKESIGELWAANAVPMKAHGDLAMSGWFCAYAISAFVDAGNEESLNNAEVVLDQLAQIFSECSGAKSKDLVDFAGAAVLRAIEKIDKAGLSARYARPVAAIRAHLSSKGKPE